MKFRRGLARLWGACLAVLITGVQATPAAKISDGLDASDLAVIINADDPLSVQIGELYAQRRLVPAANVVRVHMRRKAVLTEKEFARVRVELDARVPRYVQAYALVWTIPFRVECMSITSAFAFGFDTNYCASACLPTPVSAYFNSDSRRPFRDLKIRPAMLIAAEDLAQARALIDRGMASDGTAPHGTAYLLSTSDKARNVRAPSFSSARMLEREGVRVEIVNSDVLSDRQDVMFYFTGAIRVPGLTSNRFLPGAIGDHLTSSGGVLNGSRQMSSLRWLEAGATGSYGTVVEPCAFPAKFPSVLIVMSRYLAGETLIEAYWKSVAMPSQGLFLGEPLAAPYDRERIAQHAVRER